MAKEKGTNDELLEKARAHIIELEQELQRLMSPPHTLATVLKQIDDATLLVSGDKIISVPEEVKGTTFQPGQQITVNGMGAFVGTVDLRLSGVEAVVKRVFTDMLEIEGGASGAVALIFKGAVSACETVKPGDTVQLDRTGSVALRVVPKDNSKHAVETATGVTWADIGGQEEAIKVLREAIEGPLLRAKLWQAYGKRPIKGVLLHGAPGCGKTLLAKATANAIREAHGGDEAATAFIYVKGPEVLNMWVGNTEAQIRALFAQSKEHWETHGFPATIFIDEADAILGVRGSRHGSILSSTVVPTFLAEMDGLVNSGAFVLLATNRPDTLDPAITREGRIDRKVAVNRPGMRETAQILNIHLKKTKVAHETRADQLAGVAAAELFSDAHVLYRVGLKGKGVFPFYIRSLLSGALLAGVVDMATSVAIERDAEAGKASGLTEADVTEAVQQVVKANKGLNHEADLHLFAEAHGAQIEGVQRVAA